MLTAADTITKDEFYARFKAEMLRVAQIRFGSDKFEDGEPIADYADMTAVTYWDDPDCRVLGPEECALADMSYWGEE